MESNIEKAKVENTQTNVSQNAQNTANETASSEKAAPAQPFSRKQLALRGFLYGLVSTALFFVLFLFYLRDGAIRSFMTASSWVFYLAAAIPHGAVIALAIYLAAYLPAACLVKRPRLAIGLSACLTAAGALIIFINSFVYSIYRFHIDGMILSFLLSPDANEVFSFGPQIVLQALAALAASGLLAWGLIRLTDRLLGYFSWKKAALASGVILCLALGTQTAHVVSAASQQSTPIIKSTHVLPHYYPLTINGFLIDHGFIEGIPWTGGGRGKISHDDIAYPRHPLDVQRPDKLPNIIFLGIDSLSMRVFNREVMPNVMNFAEQKADIFRTHLSSSNRTRGSLYGLFFGLSAFHWEEFGASGVTPLFLEQLMAAGYGLSFYPSATLLNPPIAQTLFASVPNFRASTPGKDSYERDIRITEDFLADLPALKASGKPFFAFVFYDLPHTSTMPPEKAVHFTPSWTFPDYARLTSDLDPTPFFNLYKNATFEADALVGRVLRRLEEEGLFENSIVMIFGDHGQEFNETGKNFWGHGSDFSPWQVMTPMIFHAPGQNTPRTFEHRTTHYDVVPTLMKTVLGVQNPPDDYSMGHLLWDASSPRDWHPVGEHSKRGFILSDWTIVRRLPSGALEVTDKNLNEIPGYKVDLKALNQVMRGMAEFYRR